MMYTNICKALYLLIINSNTDIYLQELCLSYINISTSYTLDKINHLYVAYSIITP